MSPLNQLYMMMCLLHNSMPEKDSCWTWEKAKAFHSPLYQSKRFYLVLLCVWNVMKIQLSSVFKKNVFNATFTSFLWTVLLMFSEYKYVQQWIQILSVLLHIGHYSLDFLWQDLNIFNETIFNVKQEPQKIPNDVNVPVNESYKSI